MIDPKPVTLKPEDSPAPLSLVRPPADPQAVMIALAEIAQRLGSEAVQLLHLYDHGHDLIEINRRAKLHAREVHYGAARVLETVEALSKALRAAGAFSTRGSASNGR